MEKSTSSSTKKVSEEESDSDWSDINSSAGDEEANETAGERSLMIDIDEEAEVPNSAKKSNSPVQQRRHSVVKFTATSGSSKKSKK